MENLESCGIFKIRFQAWIVMEFWLGRAKSLKMKITALKHGSVYLRSENKTETWLTYEQILVASLL